MQDASRLLVKQFDFKSVENQTGAIGKRLRHRSELHRGREVVIDLSELFIDLHDFGITWLLNRVRNTSCSSKHHGQL